MTEPRDFGAMPPYQLIDKTKLVVDHRYQRQIDGERSQAAIKRIATSFSWMKFMALTVVSNGDGSYCVIDGQHRLEASRRLPEIVEVPCLIVEAETLKEQAQAFVDLNTDKVALTPLALHHARVRAGDARAIAIETVIEAAGCRVPKSVVTIERMKCGDIVCLSKVKVGITRFGAATVKQALVIIRTAWPDGGGVRSEILSGVMTVIAGGADADSVRIAIGRRRPDQIVAMAYGRRAAAVADPKPLIAHVLDIINELLRQPQKLRA